MSRTLRLSTWHWQAFCLTIDYQYHIVLKMVLIKQTVKLKLTLYEYLFEKGLFAIIFFNVFTERDKY